MILAILDTMWGTPGSAPHWFQINPRNRSGQRLYSLMWHIDNARLMVTNACPQQTGHASQHGTPSAAWLRECFQHLPYRGRTAVLLVCGKVAKKTYQQMLKEGKTLHRGPVLFIDHPAARNWTQAKQLRVTRRINKAAGITLNRRAP